MNFIFGETMKPVARWTIGNTTKDGYECLILSIESFLKFYDADVVVCHNCPAINLATISGRFPLVDQTLHLDCGPKPIGVAWKLYPPRLFPDRHEICIDNDIIFNARIKEIDQFFESSSTLLLAGDSRTYGRFEKHVPAQFMINSGIYGMPPSFDLERFVKFYAGDRWEKNALYQHDKSETFDEQGLVALALLSHAYYIIIPNTVVTNCEYHLNEGAGYHFIGLNRSNFHAPFRLYKSRSVKLYL